MRQFSGYGALVLTEFLVAIVAGAGSEGAEGIWTRKADMPTARLGFSSNSVVDGKIYAIGGVKDEFVAVVSAVEVYDPVTDIWMKTADMPHPGRVLSSSVVDGIIYLFVERGQSIVVDAYDPETDTWIEKADIVTEEADVSIGVVDGIIYAVFEGHILRAYDPVTSTWTTKAPMPSPRGRFAISVVDGIIYAVGGVLPPNWWGLRTVEAYDPVTNTWTKKADMPTGRYSLSTSPIDGRIYAFGGWRNSASGPLYSAMEVYNPATDTWTRKADMPESRALLSTGVVDGKIYAIGGTSTTHPMTSSSTVYEYDTGLGVPSPDFNADGVVNIADLLRLIESWGQDDPDVDIAPPPFGDGVIDSADLEVLMSYWGQEVDDPSLRAHWRFDETEGATAPDSAGDNDATIMGTPLWHPAGGTVDGALEFGGATYVATDCVLDPMDGPFSVLAWVKGGAPGQVVVSQQGGANWLMADTLDGSLMTDLRAGGRSPISLGSQTVIADGNWHRIAFTWDGANRRLYVDEVLVAEDTQKVLEGSSGKQMIGCGPSMTPDTCWTGLIDDVRIYNRVVQP